MKKTESTFNSIMVGLQQAIDHEKGTLQVRRRKVTISELPEYDAENIRSIRTNLNLSQLIFAEALGVSVKTIEAWESGRNKPQGPALRMLQLLESDTHFLEDHKIICI